MVLIWLAFMRAARNSHPLPLQGLRERYEAHHKLRYTDEALMAAAKYSSQYISDRFLPDKAIDLIDEAGSRVRLRHIQLPEEARELDKELKQVRRPMLGARVGAARQSGVAGAAVRWASTSSVTSRPIQNASLLSA